MLSLALLFLALEVAASLGWPVAREGVEAAPTSVEVKAMGDAG